ncbi:MAG TPA: SH3 domain-containing protein [Clostridiaceae bacterium]|nr:SH3 domain-containing protein [Clostridiaceae bacterium]
MAITIKIRHATKSPCYNDPRKMQGVLGGMLHSVGCPQASADNWAARWNRVTARVCPTYVTEPGVAIQCLPEDKRPWTSGSGPNGNANNYMFQVEMAEPKWLKYGKGGKFTVAPEHLEASRKYVIENYWTAVELFADIFKRRGLDPLAKIKGKNHLALISHKEGHKAGVASNHGDPEHLWAQLKLPFTMDTFRHDVKAAMTGSTTPAPKPAESKRVQIITPHGLNVREKPSTLSKRLKTLPKDSVVEIAEETSGWGYVPAEKGWLHLGTKYVKVLATEPAPKSTPKSVSPPKPSPADKVDAWAKANTLKQGDKGPVVGVLQAILINLGYTDDNKMVTDENLGPLTDRMVKEFQTDHKLYVDGVVGPQTWEALMK